jgi:hypothetical protein
MKRVLCIWNGCGILETTYLISLGLGVRDSVGGTVVVVRHRIFNRHLDVPWEQTGLIHLQTLFQLQVGVSANETLDKILTEPFFPVWVDPTLDRQDMFTCRCRTGQEYPVLTNLLDVFKTHQHVSKMCPPRTSRENTKWVWDFFKDLCCLL